jgi:hypothetical protein
MQYYISTLSLFILLTYYIHDSGIISSLCRLSRLSISLYSFSPHTLHIYTQNLGLKSLFYLSQNNPLRCMPCPTSINWLFCFFSFSPFLHLLCYYSISRKVQCHPPCFLLSLTFFIFLFVCYLLPTHFPYFCTLSLSLGSFFQNYIQNFLVQQDPNTHLWLILSHSGLFIILPL